MADKICEVCKKECANVADRIHCMGTCRKIFHSKCVGFTPVSLKFYRQCENLTYECEDCRDNPYRMINITLDKILSFMCILDERMNRQETSSDSILKHLETLNSNLNRCENEIKTEINKAVTVKNVPTPSVSCAEIVKKPVPEQFVLVRPKAKQKCSATRADLDNINIPKKIAISSLNNMSNGGIEIKCKKNNDLSKLHKIATKELGEDYSVIMPKQQKPKVRVTNMSEKKDGVDIISCMRNQNELLKDAEMEVLHVFEVKHTESYGAIVKVDPKTFNTLMKAKKVVIGMNICKVTESLSVLRCYKCCGYQHKSDTCRNRKACLRCGGEHVSKECQATKSQCINCKVVAEKHKIKLDLDHPAWSRMCTVLQRNIEKQMLRINYAE